MTDNAFIAAARAGLNSFWRYLVTVLLVIFLVISGGACLGFAGLMAGGTTDLNALPGYFLLALNLLPFLFIPIALWIGLRVLHKRPFISIVNPSGRFNWGRFFFAGLVWLALAAVSDVVLAAVSPGNYVFTFDVSRFWPFLVVALLLIPVQSSAEEFLFRGYLTQGFGLLAWWLGWLIPAVLFGLLHGANPEVGAYGVLLTMPVYIGLGLLLGWVTLRTQSLEMALGMHIFNNLYSTLLVTFPSSALQTEAVFTIREYNALLSLIAFVVMALVFVLILETVGRGAWRRGSGLTAVIVMCLVGPLVLSACGAAPAAPVTQVAAAAETVTATAAGEIPTEAAYPAPDGQVPAVDGAPAPDQATAYPAENAPGNPASVTAPAPAGAREAAATAPGAGGAEGTGTPEAEGTVEGVTPLPEDGEVTATPAARGGVELEEGAAAETVGRVSMQPCWLSSQGAARQKALCGWVTVPENRDQPDGRQIRLNVALVRAVSRNAAPDPIFLLAGGPGQAATETFPALLPGLEKLRTKRDLVLVDQRGTGGSNPLVVRRDRRSRPKW